LPDLLNKNKQQQVFILHLVLSKQDIQCDVMLHTHLKVEAFPHTTLARLWQLSCFHWLIVSRIEKFPQKLPTLTTCKFRSAQSTAFLKYAIIIFLKQILSFSMCISVLIEWNWIDCFGEPCATFDVTEIQLHNYSDCFIHFI